MTDAERTAAHEAGHACACVLLGVPVRLVDVVGDARTLGVVRHGLEQMYNRDDARKRMIIILCGPIEGADHWADVPSWPLNPAASTDEHNLHALAEYQGLDREGYNEIRARGAEPDARPVLPVVARRGHGDARLLPAHRPGADRSARRDCEGGLRMDRLLLKATVTTTDEGLFSAVISTAAADRENDVVIPGVDDHVGERESGWRSRRTRRAGGSRGCRRCA
ncbi:MAG TPA: hypothetical protein VFY47_04240 [Thermoleophilaceae bacterium]|nr:hypothetical protein [Thermoleophilaceae bacterium]